LKGDFLPFDKDPGTCLRRRAWSADDPGAGLEGKLVATMAIRAPRRRVRFRAEYLKLDDGAFVALRFQGGIELVRFDGSRVVKGDGGIPLQLGKRYRAIGVGYTNAEFFAEMRRLGHEITTITGPPNCDTHLEVFRLIELERVDPVKRG